MRTQRVQLEKVLGTENPADLMTKHLDQASLDNMLTKMGIEIAAGRAASAPGLNTAETVQSFEDSGDYEREETPDTWLAHVQGMSSGGWADEDSGNEDMCSLELVELSNSHGSLYVPHISPSPVLPRIPYYIYL